MCGFGPQHTETLSIRSHIVEIFELRGTWRIIPVSKWLVTPIYKPFRPFGRGPTTPGLGDLRSPWLLTTYPSPGMILQASASPWFPAPGLNKTVSARWFTSWPFNHLVGGHLTFERVTFSPSQKGHKELPGGFQKLFSSICGRLPTLPETNSKFTLKICHPEPNGHVVKTTVRFPRSQKKTGEKKSFHSVILIMDHNSCTLW